MAAEELRRTKGLNVMGQGGGSTRGFEDCIAGRNSLGAMARELTPEEKAQVIAFPIAYDGVGIVVHASNQIAGSDDRRSAANLSQASHELVRLRRAKCPHRGGAQRPRDTRSAKSS